MMPVHLNRFFFLLLFFLPGLTAISQEVLVSEGLNIRNDYGYELIGRLRDRILLFRDRYDEFEVQAYDNQLRMSWNRELNDIGRNGVQILGVVGGKNDFSVVYKARKRGHTLLRMNKYDPGANLIDTITLKDYGERVFSPPQLDLLYSENRNCIAVYNTAERGKLEITCFRIDKMQTLWDKRIDLKTEAYEERLSGMALSDDGGLYICTDYNNRRSKLDEHYLEIRHLNQDLDKVVQAPLPTFFTCDFDFVYDNVNHRLSIGGVYGDKGRDRANGIFTIFMDAAYGFVQRSEPFDDKFISILRQKDLEGDEKGVEDCRVRDLTLRRDGGMVLVCERIREIQRGAAASRGFWREGMRLVIDYYYDDIFVVAVQPDGQVHWKTVLHKKQYSQDDEATFSSYFLARNPEEIHLMFNDEIKYENTCSEYVLSPAGEFDRNSLLTTSGKNLRLRFRDAIQISAGECLVPSEFRGKLRMVLLQF